MPDTTQAPPAALNLRLSDDKVQVLLDCPDPHRNLSDTVTAILAAFESLELPEYPDAEFLTHTLQNICPAGEDIVDAVLMMGQAPIPPQDGRLEWSRDYFADGWVTEDGSETVDFWAKLDNRAVVADEKLLEMHPAIPGTPGLNVFGNKIAVDKPDKVRVRCGKGVRESETETGAKVFTAEIAGRVRFTDNTLAVDDIYIIKGNVNLETGNITHTGTLQIEGDVETGASIAADGDIVIKGMVEPADIRAGGSLTVNGGVVGSEENHISVGGDLQAKYIKEALIRAEGDITVTSEINHCDIETRGRVDASRGRIAGGRTIARKGITVGEAGASGASQTLLAAGVDPTLATRVAAKRKTLRQLEKERANLRQVIQTATEKPGGPDDTEKTLLATLDTKASKMGQAIADGERELRNMINEAMAEAREEIFMLRECWSGTTVQLGEYKSMVRVSIMKPRLAKRFKDRVRVVPMGENNGPEDT